MIDAFLTKHGLEKGNIQPIPEGVGELTTVCGVIFEMCPVRNVQFWNVLFLECTLFGMCSF